MNYTRGKAADNEGLQFKFYPKASARPGLSRFSSAAAMNVARTAAKQWGFMNRLVIIAGDKESRESRGCASHPGTGHG